MGEQTIQTTHGTSLTLSTAKVERFASGLAGGLLRRGDTGYDEVRRVWNGMVDKRPALIARCAGTADVVASVRFARASTTCWSRCAAAATTTPASRSAKAA